MPRGANPPDSSTHPSSLAGFGVRSPNPNKKSSPSRKLQQALFEEGLILDAEERARQQQHEVLDLEVQNSNPNSKVLINARGNPYAEGDPNLGYSGEDIKPGYAKSELKKGKNAVVELDVTHLDENCWSHCLVGHFLDERTDYRLANSTAHKLWGKMTKYGLLSVKSDNAGFLYFEFKDEASQLAVLEGGPWFFSQKFLVLKKWRRMMTPTKISPSSIPTWVKLHNLPPECWTEEGLSRVASAIGQPKHVDRATEKKTRLAYARVCVEIDAADELTEEIQVIVEGESVTVRVEYQLLPPVCTCCKVFGHASSRCPRSIPHTQTVVQGLTNKEWQTITKGNSAKNIGGAVALDAVTIPVVDVVDTSMPRVAEGVINDSDSEGEELIVNADIPLEVKGAAGPSSSAEVVSVSLPQEPDPAATVVLPSHPVLIVKSVPPDDIAETVKGKAAFQNPHELKSHNNKGNGKSSGRKWSSSSKRRNK
ncbi:hypothetical protein RHMOL_Rhmol03G0148300 [Rhododendron molle]|uniref:Uncharacterized protein n=1 Tax=Rhododendron molle TaxID=49168 RepID=A0ACC0PFM0_RHOML|nr:hypothetical protein RHMOL_Rhmol03G0148300 [Rhododendron molle]